MNYQEILNLLQFVEASNFNDFEIDYQGAKIKLSKNKTVEASATVPQENVVTNLLPVNQENKVAKEVPMVQEPITAPMTIMPVEKQEITGSIIKSPIVGTFYNSSTPTTPAFVKVGDTIKKGDVLCIVEAMKVMNEITSTFDGVVTKVLVENEDVVEYDQPLFEIDEK